MLEFALLALFNRIVPSFDDWLLEAKPDPPKRRIGRPYPHVEATRQIRAVPSAEGGPCRGRG